MNAFVSFKIKSKLPENNLHVNMSSVVLHSLIHLILCRSNIMPFSALRHLFSRGSSEGADPEVGGAVSFFKRRFTISQNKSLLTTKTNEIEAKIVQHLARFASVPSDDVFESVSLVVLSVSYLYVLSSLMSPSRPTGLFSDEVSHGLLSHGPNVLSSTVPVMPLVLLYCAMFNPFDPLLTILAIISIATGDKATFSIMLLMVLISSGLRYLDSTHFGGIN